MPWGVAAAAVGAAGSLAASSMSKGSGSGGSSATSQNTGPWGPQQAYVNNGLQSARTIFTNRDQAGPYTGEFTAPGNDTQTNAANTAGLYNQGQGAALPYQTGNTASSLQQAAQPYLQNAQNLAANGNGINGRNAGLYGALQNYGTGQQTTQGPNSQLSSALNNAAVSGAGALTGFQNTLTGAANAGLSNPTQRIANDAQTYANAPQVQASVDATNAAIDQTLHQQTLPTMAQQQSMAGGLNSSRSGMAEGMARQASATSKGLADANIYNNALNTGMNTAGSLYASGLNTATQAGMFGYNDMANNANTVGQNQTNLNQFNTNTQLNAANSGLNAANANSNTMLNANNQLGNATGMGINGATSAINQAGQNFQLGSAAGTLQQQQQQATDTNAYQQWQMQNGYQQGILQNYWGIASTPLGQSASGSYQAQNPSNPIGALGGGAALGYGLYQNSGQGGQSGSGLFSGNGALSANSLNSNFGTQFGAGTFPSAANPYATVPGYQADNYTPL